MRGVRRRKGTREREEDKKGRNKRITAKLESGGLGGSLQRWADNFQEQRGQAEPPAVAVM